MDRICRQRPLGIAAIEDKGCSGDSPDADLLVGVLGLQQYDSASEIAMVTETDLSMLPPTRSEVGKRSAEKWRISVSS